MTSRRKKDRKRGGGTGKCENRNIFGASRLLGQNSKSLGEKDTGLEGEPRIILNLYPDAFRALSRELVLTIKKGIKKNNGEHHRRVKASENTYEKERNVRRQPTRLGKKKALSALF